MSRLKRAPVYNEHISLHIFTTNIFLYIFLLVTSGTQCGILDTEAQNCKTNKHAADYLLYHTQVPT